MVVLRSRAPPRPSHWAIQRAEIRHAVLYRQGLGETAPAITTKCHERGAPVISSDADQNIWVVILVDVDDQGRRLQDRR
jgi:hypothetical protein